MEKKDIFLPSSTISKEPRTFQFQIIGDILKLIYERLLGYRVTIKKVQDPKTGMEFQKIEKEKVFEPLVTDWGANRIITLVYQFINEQTPFSHITANTVVKMTNIFLKQLNADIYKNFEKYFDKKHRSITLWRLILTTVGFIVLEVLSRGIEGRESLMFYESNKITITGQLGGYKI